MDAVGGLGEIPQLELYAAREVAYAALAEQLVELLQQTRALGDVVRAEGGVARGLHDEPPLEGLALLHAIQQQWHTEAVIRTA